MLRDVPIQVRYSSSQNISADFFVPCLQVSCSYDRAVGYFSSTFYAIIGMPLASFAERGGKMRLVCSPELSAEDIEAIAEGYEDKGLAAHWSVISMRWHGSPLQAPRPRCSGR